MRLRSLWLALLALLALLGLAGGAAARERGEDELRRDMEFAREQVYPALVNIAVVVKEHAAGRAQRFPAAGSGVIVSPAGHVVTNYHVAGDATRILCRLPSQEAIEAQVVAHDPLTDISVLKLDLSSRSERNRPIPFARLGDSDELTTGDYVLAMGNPLTLSSSMTLGVVSNPSRVFASFTGAEMDELDLGEGQVTGLFTRWIQHDALILPGNSGGPLVNLKGEIVGINELGGGGVGFAIPSNLVSWVLNQALTHGDIVRGWLGIEIAPTEKTPDPAGAIVAFVQPGGPAEKAGIAAGDRLLQVDGEAADARHLEEIPVLYARFARLEPGRAVKVLYRRGGGEPREASVAVGRMEKYLAEEQEEKRLGITLRDITGPMALLRRYPDEKGVLVTGVRPGLAAEAAKPPVLSGDVVREIDGKPVEDADGCRKILADLGERTKVAVRLRREAEDVLTVIDLARKKPPKGGGELQKPWIGVRTQVLTPDLAEALGLPGVKGFRVTQVFEGTRAEAARLQVGDVLVSLDGEPLPASRIQDAEMLTRRVERLEIGKTAKVALRRGADEVTLDVLLEETPMTAEEVPSAADEILEYKARAITFADRVENRWPRDQAGVVVTEVTSGGWANLAGLRPLDLILRLNDRPIATVKDLEEEVKRVAETRPKTVPFFVRRVWRTKFLFAEPEYESAR